MTKQQKRIELLHHRLMDIRDSTPYRRGLITREREYLKVYLRAYETSGLSKFYGAAENLRHFLQDFAVTTQKGNTK